MKKRLEKFDTLHRSMWNTYHKYGNVLKPLHRFYCQQKSKDISLPNKNDRFYLKEF